MKLQTTMAAALLAFAAGCEDYNNNDDIGGGDDAIRTTPNGTAGGNDNAYDDTPSTGLGGATDRSGAGATGATGSGGMGGMNNSTRGGTGTGGSSTGAGSTGSMGSGGTGTSGGSGATSGGAGGGGVTPAPAGGAQGASLASVDRTFVMDAASGGMFEVQSSQLALDQLDDQELKQAAQMILDDHTQANAELKQIAQRKGVTIPTTLQSNHQQMLTKLRDADGGQLAQQYRQAQVQAHQDAIAKFEQYAQNGQDQDLKAFAQKCLPKLRMHLEELQQAPVGTGEAGQANPSSGGH